MEFSKNDKICVTHNIRAPPQVSIVNTSPTRVGQESARVQRKKKVSIVSYILFDANYCPCTDLISCQFILKKYLILNIRYSLMCRLFPILLRKFSIKRYSL